MARKHLQSLLNQLWVLSPKRKLAGFTLIELLLAMAIGSIAISLILALITSLLQTDQQESVRNTTQSEMQMALDYISQDMREATYVYDGSCIQGRADDPATAANEYCPGIVNHITIPPNSVPILAFWKLDPLPPECQIVANQTPALCGPFLLAGRTPTLVVYFLRRNQSSDAPQWRGQARITRYELDQFTVSNGNLTPTSGYVNPNSNGTSYRTWPRRQVNGTWTNDLQTSLPDSSNSMTLVDFVDAGVSNSQVSCDPSSTPQYIASPLSNTPGNFASVSSFYACVRDITNQQSGLNQDVLVYLRGNPGDRQGNYDNRFFPTLQTQVLGRGVVGKQPQTPQ